MEMELSTGIASEKKGVHMTERNAHPRKSTESRDQVDEPGKHLEIKIVSDNRMLNIEFVLPLALEELTLRKTNPQNAVQRNRAG
jgi:hypothetical protein